MTHPPSTIPAQKRTARRTFLCLVFSLLAFSSLGAAEKKGEFILTCLDIPDIKRGAGLALVLQLPSGKTCLYDTGSGYPDATSPDGWQAGFNAGRDLILPFLQKHGIKEIDTVFISHAHYDHFGGLMWLKDHVKINRLVDSGFTYQGAASADYTTELSDYEKLRAEFKAQGKYQEAHTGDTLKIDEQIALEVLAPPHEFFTKPFPELRAENDPPAHYLVNANSLGMRLTFGKVVFYLPGDIQAEDQVLALLPSLPPEKFKCDVLVAPGHGLHAPRQFADVTRPQLTLCSVFPRYAKGLSARKIFGAVGSKVLVTGLSGWLQVTSEGTTYTAATERPESEEVK